MDAWVLRASLPKTTPPSGEKVWEEVLKWEEVALPSLALGYARIKVEASALNRRDLWIALGLYPRIQYPAILGSDGVGEVVAVGSPQDQGWVGQKVILNPSLDWGPLEKAQSEAFHILGMPTWGTFAEYVDVPVANLHAFPAHLSLEEAAAVPLAGLTAYRAAFVQGGLQAGQKVLVPGIGGGVATWVLQLAVAAGAEVWVTSSAPHKIEKARALGAAGGVPYTRPDWAEKLLTQAGSFDLVIDGVGGDAFPAYLTLVAPGGRIVVYGATRGNPPALDLRRLFWRQVHLIGSTMGSPADFEAMLCFLKEKRVRPFVETTLPLSSLPRALSLLWEGRQMGKVVLRH